MPPLPPISIVVPNYNNGSTLRGTLQSLVEQEYPRLEILVVDGGSTDESVAVIREFAPAIHGWVSEPDRGQAHAINKGFARCTGEVVNWLCSDDRLAPGALHVVGRHFAESPETDVLVGRCCYVHGKQGGRITVDRPTRAQIEMIPACVPFAQPSCFYRRSLLDRPEPLDESYHYTMDVELWAYFRSRGVRWTLTDTILSIYPMSGENKTSTGGVKITRELERVYTRYVRERIPLTYWHRRLRYPLERLRQRQSHRLAAGLVRGLQVAPFLLLAPFYGFRRVRAMNWSAFV